jgi:hypothetical protein
MAASTFHSLHAISKQLAPVPSGGIQTVHAPAFTLHCFESPTGVKFFATARPNAPDAPGFLRKVYEYYGDYVLKVRGVGRCGDACCERVGLLCPCVWSAATSRLQRVWRAAPITHASPHALAAPSRSLPPSLSPCPAEPVLRAGHAHPHQAVRRRHRRARAGYGHVRPVTLTRVWGGGWRPVWGGPTCGRAALHHHESICYS